MVKRVVPAVVNVYAARVIENRNPFFNDPMFRQFFGAVPREQVQRSLGSGVIVDPAGLIVTNYHVIEGASEVKVALVRQARVRRRDRAKDEHSDLTVLRLKDVKERFPVLDFGNSDELQVGDVVLAIGDPFGVGQTVTHGIVSAVARTQVGVSDYRFFIQTDAAINPGNSGGALVDLNGRLIGINSAIYSRSGGSQGIGFAIPANMVRVVVASAKGGSAAVKRPWLGAKLQEVTPEIAESLGLKRPSGALVASLASEPRRARRAKNRRSHRQHRRHRRRRPERLRLSLRHQVAGRHGADRLLPAGQGAWSCRSALQAVPERAARRRSRSVAFAVPRRHGGQSVAGAGRRAAARSAKPGRGRRQRSRRLGRAIDRVAAWRYRGLGQQSEHRQNRRS